MLPEVTHEVFFFFLSIIMNSLNFIDFMFVNLLFSFSFFLIYTFKGRNALKHTFSCMSQVLMCSIFIIVHFSCLISIVIFFWEFMKYIS